MEIDINLSDKASINKTIEKLNEMKMAEGFDDRVVNNLVDICYKRCIENLDSMKIYPNTQFRAIKNAISKQYAKDGVGYVKIKSPATFVELGTGIKGSEEPHPSATEIGWIYGDHSWIYPTDENASNPNKWQTENGDWLGFTRGQPARPFAYEAAMFTKQIAKDEVKISFNDIIGK